jgi:hypothetical protein
MSNAYRRGAGKFCAIRRQDDMVGVVEYFLQYLHLSEVEIQQAPIFVNGRHTDNRIIHFELVKRIRCGFPNNAAVGWTNHPACNDDFKFRVNA